MGHTFLGMGARAKKISMGMVWAFSEMMQYCNNKFKDGAYFCYCAYALRISRYLGYLWVVPTNTGIFLHGLKLCGESRTKQVLFISKKKIGGNRAFFRDNKQSS